MDEMLSQDEINALLAGVGSDDAGSNNVLDEDRLSADTKDAIGEIANISMGSSATTLYSLVNMKVDITTPVVTMANWDTVVADYERPCVFIQIHYTAGLDGSNIMILKEHDVKVITDLMMGGDGSNTDGEIGELHLSAISEAMNQMMGAAATSLSTMMGKMIDISPPEASVLDLNDFKSGGDIAPFLEGSFVKIAFRMQIGDLVDSSIMQLYPVEFAESLYERFIAKQMEDVAASAPEPARTCALYTAAGGYERRSDEYGRGHERYVWRHADAGHAYDGHGNERHADAGYACKWNGNAGHAHEWNADAGHERYADAGNANDEYTACTIPKL